MRKWSELMSPLVFFGAAGLGLTLFATALLVLWLLRPAPTPKGPATAIVKIIPAPTATPLAAAPTPTQSPTPTAPPPPLPPPGNISLGAFVQVTGTGGDGLRVRTEPGLQGQVIFLAIDAEVFRVDDGPREADGYTWWYLVAPFEETRRGWAVSNYLEVIQNPEGQALRLPLRCCAFCILGI